MSARNKSGDPLAALRNIGPASAAMLRGAGIESPEHLREMGPALAFKLVQHRGPVSMNLLYALAGALSDRHWADFSMEERAALRADAAAPLAVIPPPGR